MRKLLVVCLSVLLSALGAWAAESAGIRGKVLDPSGEAIPAAEITVKNTATGAASHTTSGADGTFAINGLSGGTYTLTASKTGFRGFNQKGIQLQPGENLSSQIVMKLQQLVQAVEVHATAPGATLVPTQQDVLKSNQTIRVLDRKQMDAVGPLAGAAQIVSQAPGANVVSYGNTGQSKSTIVLNGINQGWGGYGGYNYPGSLGVTLDGIPITDAATGLWPSATLPQTNMFQNVNVIYGPGDPADRWYTNVGGGFDFVPVQPAHKAHIDGTLSFGSYNQQNLELNMLTGLYHGWSSVLSVGLGKGDSFRNGIDNFSNPGKDGAFYFKTTRAFQSGSFSVGGYYARAGAYRPQVIPMTPVAGLTVEGLNVPGAEVYSQQTSGFYSTLPYTSYNKYDINELGVIYAKEEYLLSNTSTVHNETWFTHEFRFHERNDDVYVSPGQINEWNNPHHNTVGDEISINEELPFNKLSEGGYFLHDIYNSRNNFFNPALGGSGEAQIVNIGGKVRSSYFTQDNYAGFIQDDFHPIARLHITPGVRFDRFATGYYSGTLEDFTFLPGVVLSTHCPETGASTPGNTNDQGASCGNHQTRTAVEPSINVSGQPLSWLTLYGGYAKTYRSPSLGGGGGLFQSLDPSTNYILSSGAYYQAGFKVNFQNVGNVRNMLFGAAYYHLRYANEQLGVELGNGNFINTSGSSNYHGVNAYFDLDPLSNLHVFTNLNGEGATYDQFYSGNFSFQGLPVSYVPSTTVNTGAYFSFARNERTYVEPRVWFQFIGPQHLFDNCGLQNGACTTAAPSNRTEPSYSTVNLSLRVPYKFLSFDLDALNVLDRKYNEFEYVSAGGYYGTSTAGYTFAYPAPPFTLYASIGFHF